jgi:hypothetical protein
MSANKFKVGNKVKVRKGLVADECYGDVYCNSSMARMGGTVFIVDRVESDFYRVEEYPFCWSDEMLELVEKALDDLCAGDFVRSGGSVRKVLAAVDGCYLLSHIEKYTHAFAWYTVNELRESGYNFIESDAPEPVIEIDGKKYEKADVEKVD